MASGGETIRSGLLILGSFAFAYNASLALHECGHAVAMMLTGAGVERITLHPFSWSYAYAASVPTVPNGEAIATWAGPLGGAAIGIVLLLVVWRWRSTSLFPLLLLGAICLLHNGFYLITDTVLAGGGDATDLIQLGTPTWFVVLTGALLAIAGMACAVAIIPFMGLRSSASCMQWVATLSLGFVPYLVAMLLFHVVTGSTDVERWIIKLGAGIAAVPLFAVATWALARHRTPPRHAAPPSWTLSLVALAGGVTVVMAELVAFSRPLAPVAP